MVYFRGQFGLVYGLLQGSIRVSLLFTSGMG